MAADSPQQSSAPRRPPVEAGDTSRETKSTDSGESRLGLLATTTPQQSLDTFRQLQQMDQATPMPSDFGHFALSGVKNASSNLTAFVGSPFGARDRYPGAAGSTPVENAFSDPRDDRARAGRDKSPPKTAKERYEANDPVEPQLPGTVRTDRTRVHGTGSRVDTGVEIRYGESGKPHFVRDQEGEWASKDGGKTWKTDEPKFAIRRGDVSIDSKGNYSFENTDYGLKSTYSPDGTSRRSITTSGGDTYSVSRDKKGVPTEFSDKSGDWTSTNGRHWTNSKTNDTKTGNVSLSEHGEFRFRPEGKGDQMVAQSLQLERINQMKEQLTQKYGVTFAKPGEVESRPETRDGGMGPGGMGPQGPRSADPVQRAGVATEAELKTLGIGLEKTSHENYKGMKVWFMQRGDYNPGEMAVYKPNESGSKGQGHQHSGGCCGRGVERKNNGDLVVNAPARQDTSGFDTFERTSLHELAHHEQMTSLGKMKGEMVGPGSSPESRKLADEMGWEWSTRSKQPVFRDKDGGRWARVERPDGPPYWKHDSGTQPKDKKARLDDFEMRERAEVKPITAYYTIPHESHAESLAQFRVGVSDQFKGGRRGLAQESPKLYETTKRYDQGVIDKKFGINSNGESKIIRAIDGTLVENTPEARRTVEEREKAWRRRGHV
ncbi:MAG: hypothetical protein SGJ27_11500 [Candidatus Melainabacteria bacterium]|nr:hypothetical protein [Candidatus Melainabacteria bacterium]